jgi:glycosyltransferase involved in cell wall biosynthesis
MNNSPLITIITATFNAVKDLEKSIESVLSQSYANIQYVIIDGASTDGTVEILNKYSTRISAWISEPDNGIYDAWNKGLKLAEGEWIIFLGADDVLVDNSIRTMVDYLVTNQLIDYDIVSSRVQLLNGKGEEIKVIGKKWKWRDFKKYMTIAHVGAFHSKAFFNKYGNFDTEFKIAGDYELILRANNLLNASFLDSVTIKMKIGGISSQLFSSLSETYRAKIKNKARSKILASFDYLFALAKFYLRFVIKR